MKEREGVEIIGVDLVDIKPVYDDIDGERIQTGWEYILHHTCGLDHYGTLEIPAWQLDSRMKERSERN